MPAQQNFSAYGGDTFKRVFKFLEDDLTTPIVISTWEFAMELKYNGKGTAVLKLTTTPAAGLTKGGVANNELTMLTPMPHKPGMYSYDLEITKPDGTIVTYISGIFTITQDITNAV
jgi:hypothetical protein